MMSSASSPSKGRRRRGRLKGSYIMSFVSGCYASSMFFTAFHGKLAHHMQSQELESPVGMMPLPLPLPDPVHEEDSIGLVGAKNPSHGHAVAGLDCKDHGGPDNDAQQEMMYWKDIPLDNDYISPFKQHDERQYLTFEMHSGSGWNTVRVVLETVLTMAIATGRVLVLPPPQKIQLMGRVDLFDTFPFHDIVREHAGVEVISTKQFLEENRRKVKKVSDGPLAYPPWSDNTNFDGLGQEIQWRLEPWLQSISNIPKWSPQSCLVAFPKSRDPKDAEELQETLDEILRDHPEPSEKFFNNPTPVNATTKDRMNEHLAGRTRVCVYTEELQKAKILHFRKKHMYSSFSLTPFYAFLFFQDWKVDLWMKRFVRDHMRYIDDVQCAAARIVEAVREHSRSKHQNGVYDSFHISRSNFTFDKSLVSSSEILRVAKDEIPQGATVYIGTDEGEKDYFKDMKEYWDVVFLDDFVHLIPGINETHYGMIDQLVTSRGRFFFGCWYSSFTSYITRLRGYHSQNEEAEGYDIGLLPNTFYYAPEKNKLALHEYRPIHQKFSRREFPVSWRNLDLTG